jgi:hypothetical protein
MQQATTARAFLRRLRPWLGHAVHVRWTVRRSLGVDQSRSWLHVVGFAAMLALTIYVTIDLEYPRLGLIRIDYFDRLLADVRAAMR